jgi:hypothetical protein
MPSDLQGQVRTSFFVAEKVALPTKYDHGDTLIVKHYAALEALLYPKQAFSKMHCSKCEFLLGLFLQGDGEAGLAGLCRIVEGGAFTGAFAGAEEKSLFSFFREASEAGFPGGIGANFKI